MTSSREPASPSGTPEPPARVAPVELHPVRVGSLLILAAIALGTTVLAADRGSDVRERIRARAAGARLVAGERETALRAAALLGHFYDARRGLPAWSDGESPHPFTRAAIDAIGRAGEDGLDPRLYHRDRLDALHARLESRDDERAAVLAELDVLLTDAVFLLADHLLHGRIDSGSGTTRLETTRPDLVPWLRRAIEEEDVAGALARLRSTDPGYVRLRAALARVRDEAARGPWPEIPPGPPLRLGDEGEAVALLERRLRASGDLDADAASFPQRFDASLEEAVRRFQRRHGLSADGVVGRRTRAELSVPATARARQIAANLERLRWLPHERHGRRIVVNVASFTLDAFEDDVPALTMRIVVGRRTWKTPIVSGGIGEAILNPYWNVPTSIARAELVPRLRRDPGFLAREGMRVLSGWGEGAREIDPRTIDWSRADLSRLRFRQDPGPRNPLGQIKFPFPNPCGIHLHDTPSRSLFALEQRSFSHGCVRLENAMALAEWILRDEPDWSPDAIHGALAEGTTHAIRLRAPVPVHVSYLTAWVDPDGTLAFRADLYGRDAPLAAALSAAG